MKGVIFTEFLDFVEDVAGLDVCDQMIIDADPPSGGAYTAVGQYDYQEMVSLITALSKLIDQPVPGLIRAFGRHLFGRFAVLYPDFLGEAKNALDFIETVEGYIHVEVLKLYPDAQLPRLDTVRHGPDHLEVGYTSCRPFGELCIGMVEGCASHFADTVDVEHVATADGVKINIHRRARAAA